MIPHFFSFLKDAPELVFWASALFGTTLFILRLLVTFIAGISEDVGDFEDLTLEHGHDHHSATGSFKIFTIHSLSGFFMMFGWIGLACVKQLDYSHSLSLLMALLAGFATMILTALIFKGALMLVSPGTRFDIKKTVGLIGTVYQSIPHDGQGKIQLVVDGVTREILAQSNNHSTIASFKTVRVTRALDHETVIVTEITP